MRWLLLSLAIVACSPSPVSPSVGACSAACERLRSLSCPEADPTQQGASCERVCEDTQRGGIIDLGPECVARATSCHDARRCAR